MRNSLRGVLHVADVRITFDEGGPASRSDYPFGKDATAHTTPLHHDRITLLASYQKRLETVVRHWRTSDHVSITRLGRFRDNLQLIYEDVRSKYPQAPKF